VKIRLAGLGLLILSALFFGALSHLVHADPGLRLYGLEAVLGLACVGAEMLGLPLLVLGAGLFTPVRAPARPWY
jgi:hypothetical protein